MVSGLSGCKLQMKESLLIFKASLLHIKCVLWLKILALVELTDTEPTSPGGYLLLSPLVDMSFSSDLEVTSGVVYTISGEKNIEMKFFYQFLISPPLRRDY